MEPGKGINPPHYSHMAIEPLEFILANDIPFCEGNVIKYVCRWKARGGLQDLEKARTYIDRLIQQSKKEIPVVH